MNACQKRSEELVAQQPAARPTKPVEPQRPADDKPESANPFARHIAKLRAAMVSVVTEDDMQAIMQKMLAMAAAGSIPAMRLVMQYVIGKPTVAPNPDRVQIDEWHYYKETAAMTEDVSKVTGRSVLPERTLEQGVTGENTATVTAPDVFDGQQGPSRQDGPTSECRDPASSAEPHYFDGANRALHFSNR